MKVQGFQPGLAQEVISLSRGVDDKGEQIVLPLTLTALPMGFMDSVKKDIPGPVVRPIKVMREGGKVVRDSDGSPVMMTNKSSAEFEVQEDAANRRQSILMLVKSLSRDTTVEFEAKREECKSALEYADKIFDEMSDFGFSFGDFNFVLGEVLRVSNLSREKIEEAKETFTQGG